MWDYWIFLSRYYLIIDVLCTASSFFGTFQVLGVSILHIVQRCYSHHIWLYEEFQCYTPLLMFIIWKVSTLYTQLLYLSYEKFQCHTPILYSSFEALYMIRSDMTHGNSYFAKYILLKTSNAVRNSLLVHFLCFGSFNTAASCKDEVNNPHAMLMK